MTVVYNDARPAVTVSAAALDFGSQALGSIGPEQTVTVTNSGHRRLRPQSALTTTGNFVVSRDGCAGSTVAVGASCSVSIRFAPGSTGAMSDTLRLASDAPGSPHVVSLSGTGSLVGTAPGTTAAATSPKLRLLASTSKVRRGRSVRLRFNSSAAGTVTLDVVLKGKRIARVTKSVTAGNGSVTWNGKRSGRTAPRGLYTLRLRLRVGDASAVVSKLVRLR